MHLAHEQGGSALQGRLEGRELLAAYFERGESPTDHAVLTRVALDTGLDADRVAEVLASQEYDAAVTADQRQAAAYGATGVPFFVVDRAYGVSGAQPAEVFAQVLQQAWDASTRCSRSCRARPTRTPAGPTAARSDPRTPMRIAPCCAVGWPVHSVVRPPPDRLRTQRTPL